MRRVCANVFSGGHVCDRDFGHEGACMGAAERDILEKFVDLDGRAKRRSTEELMKPRKPQRYDLLPWDAIDELAAHFGRGAAKYEAREWESKGYPWSDYFNAMQRHAAEFWSGNNQDQEDEFLHVTAMAWNALALLTFALRQLPGDDRPNREALKP